MNSNAQEHAYRLYSALREALARGATSTTVDLVLKADEDDARIALALWTARGETAPALVNDAVMTGEPQVPPSVAQGWAALADWATRHCASAVPGSASVAALTTRGCELAQGFVTQLVRARHGLEALVDAAKLARWLVLVPLTASERTVVDRGFAFAKSRALLMPEAMFHLELCHLFATQFNDDGAMAHGRRVAPTVAVAERSHAGQLAAACRWVDANLTDFVVAEPLALALPSLKAIGELTHAAEILSRTHEHDLRDCGRRWMAHAWQAVGEGEAIERVVAAQPRNALAATWLPALTRAGFARQTLTDTVARQLRRARFSGPEWTYLVPAISSLGIALPDGAAQTGAAASVLQARPGPWTLLLASVYQLTHEVFYASAWGGVVDSLDEAAHEYMRMWLPCLLCVYVERQDTDVVAEILLTARCLRLPTPDSAWALLAQAQRGDGAVEPPAGRRTDAGAVTPAAEHFARHYHPTLVSIMAWAA